MTRATFRISVTVAWFLSVVIAYMVGWYRGVKSVANVATSAAGGSFNVLLYAFIVVAIIAAVLALRARGWFTSRPNDQVSAT